MKKMIVAVCAMLLLGSLTSTAVAREDSANGKGARSALRHRIAKSAIKGQVAQVGDSSFVLETRRGEVRVTWSDATRFKGGKAEDIKEGTKVGVVPTEKIGRRDLPRSVTARAVLFPKAGCDRESKAAATPSAADSGAT